jgi:hypothetical protein
MLAEFLNNDPSSSITTVTAEEIPGIMEMYGCNNSIRSPSKFFCFRIGAMTNCRKLKSRLMRVHTI